MTSRWWAPAGAHLGPDEFDLQLLQPGKDPRFDLGAAVLSLHRTGEAACRAAAESPMLDELTLVESLATARLAFAPPAVESVSKSLGDDSYAGLFVRDLADDAERAALELFTAAVSKGVAPPVAAQRAGMVYGVPAADLGTFRALATDPRVNPASLLDAADRTLFAFVEETVRQETDPETPEVVSKDATFERVHPRDRDGEFTRVKDRLGGKTGGAIPAYLAEQLNSQVDAPPAEKPTARPGLKDTRVKQTKTLKQTKKTKEPKPATAPAGPKGALKQTLTGRTMAGSLRSNQDHVLAATLRQSQRLGSQERTNVSTQGPGKHADELYFDLEVPLSYVVASHQIAGLKHGKKSDGAHLIVSGQDLINSLGDANVAGSSEDQSLVNLQASETNRLWDAPSFAAVLDRAEAKNPDILNAVKRGLAEQVLQQDDIYDPSDPDYETQRADLVENTMPMSLWSDDHDIDHSKVALVVDDPVNQPPRIHVAVVTGSQGYVEGDRHAQYRISPFQSYRVLDTVEHWDDKREVIVSVTGITAVDDVAKAEHWETERRDEDGRWTATASRSRSLEEQVTSILNPSREAATPSARPGLKQTKGSKQTKTLKTTRTVQTTPVRQVDRTLSSSLRQTASRTLSPSQTRSLNRSLRRVLREREIRTARPKPANAPTLMEEHDHLVLGLEDLHSVLVRQGYTPKEAWGALYDGDNIEVDHEAQAALMSHVPISGDRVMDELRIQTEQDVVDAEGDLTEDLFDGPFFINFHDDASVEKLLEDIFDRFDQTPHLATVQITTDEQGAITVWGNKLPVQDRVVVEYGEGVNVDEPVKLTYIGTFASHELRGEGADQYDPRTGYGPFQTGVRYYKITNPSFRHYRGTAR